MYFASVVIPSEMLDELLIGPTMFETYFSQPPLAEGSEPHRVPHPILNPIEHVVGLAVFMDDPVASTVDVPLTP